MLVPFTTRRRTRRDLVAARARLLLTTSTFGLQMSSDTAEPGEGEAAAATSGATRGPQDGVVWSFLAQDNGGRCSRRAAAGYRSDEVG